MCKCRIECGEESNPAWVDPGNCSQWSVGYGQGDHGCFSKTVTVSSAHRPDHNGRPNNLLFVKYWVLSLAVTRRCMKLITKLKLKTWLIARHVRGKTLWETSRTYNGSEWRVKKYRSFSHTSSSDCVTCTFQNCITIPTNFSCFLYVIILLRHANHWSRQYAFSKRRILLTLLRDVTSPKSATSSLTLWEPQTSGYFQYLDLIRKVKLNHKVSVPGTCSTAWLLSAHQWARQTEQHQWNCWLCWWNFIWSGSAGPNKVN